ncbi:MAG: hypothetical protein ACUVQG_00335 [Thermogutta sp.]
MTSRQQFIRKIIYLIIMAVLLGVLAYLGTPAAPSRDPQKATPGGVLAQVRENEGLTPTQLGQLDPGGEAIKLATLGMRGVAVHILWMKAEDYKRRKDWSHLSATLEQMVKLEPHFITVWRHQGWNLSYNVSVEFDDYRERFRWVIRGINFLKEGIRYNEREPILYGDVGWFYSQKIGRADESKQFRRMFMDPTDPFDIHGGLPPRDNWLVGKDWYAEAERLVDQGAILRTTPLIFHSHRPMCQMNYAEAIEKEGTFGDTAIIAWQTAWHEFVNEFGHRELPSGFEDVPIIRLYEQETLHNQVAELAQKIDELEPGLRDKLIEERRRELTPEEREAYDTPEYDRTIRQLELVLGAEIKMKLTHEQVARRISDPKKRRQALELARKAMALERQATIIAHNRNIVNYDYWKRHAEIEQQPEAVAARELMYRSEQAYYNNDHITAMELFFEAAKKWREVINKNPDIQYDDGTINDLAEFVDRYMKILDQLDAVFPEDFALQDIIRRRVRRRAEYQIAQEKLVSAKQAMAKNDLAAARADLEDAVKEYRSLMESVKCLKLLADRATISDITATVEAYDALLAQLGDVFPRNFELAELIRLQCLHTPELRAVKRHLTQAEYILMQGTGPQQLTAARQELEQGLPLAANLLKKFPHLMRLSDRRTVTELVELDLRYRQLLSKLGEALSPDYPLQEFSQKVAPLLEKEMAEQESQS